MENDGQTDYAVLRAHFKDRLGIPAKRDAPMGGYRGEWGALVGENELVYFHQQVLPIEPLSVLYIDAPVSS